MSTVSGQQYGKDTPLVRVPKEHRLEYKDFMREQMALPESDTRWKGMCESIQRQAHGFDAAFASAFAHQIATPKSERMDPRDAPVSAFIFVDDPRDSNPFGHVVGKWDRVEGAALEDILVCTNDVSDTGATYDPGNITVVKLGWFPEHWGDEVQFATTWFGGTEIPTFTPREAEFDTEEYVKVAVERARGVIEMMRKALRDNDEVKHPRHERAIQREIEDQQAIIADLKELLP